MVSDQTNSIFQEWDNEEVPLEERVEDLTERVRQLQSLVKSPGWDLLVESFRAIAEARRMAAGHLRGSLDNLIATTELLREAETFDSMANIPHNIIEMAEETLADLRQQLDDADNEMGEDDGF